MHNSLEKLSALRALMAKAKLDALIVPHSDEYQGEAIAPYAERLKWLTNFSGSNGVALILKEQAILFTDGRYHIQIRQETDNHLFCYEDLAHINVSSWLKNYGKPLTIGFDAQLHNYKDIKRLRDVVQAINGKLKALESNLIDQIWHDQPKRPQSVIFQQPYEYAGTSTIAKQEQIQNHLKEKGIDCFLFTDPTTIAWLFNIRANDISHLPVALCRAILFANSHHSLRGKFFVDFAKVEPKIKSYLSDYVDFYPEEEFLSQLESLAQTCPSLNFGLDPQYTSEKIYQILREKSAKVTFIADPVQALRAQKNAIEIAGARRAQQRDSLAMVRFLAWLSAQRAGTLSEIDCVHKLYAMRQKAGEETQMPLKDLAFDTISSTGSNSAIIHYRVSEKTNRLLQEGDLFLLDSGAQYQDGTTDITRTIAIGTPSREQKYYYSLVLEAMLKLSLACFPEGTTGSQLDVIARHVLWQEGLSYPHGTGHGVGSYLSVHEGPQAISPFNSTIFRKNMIVSNEPGYYQEGAFGIRLENLLLVVDAPVPKNLPNPTPMLAFETLTYCPFDRQLILREMLSLKTLTFLNHYHEKLYQDLAPKLNASDQAWLYQATRPI